MSMVQVKDGAIVQYRLPNVGTLSDGTTVSGYNLLAETTLRNEGWLPLEDNVIDYDPTSQYLVPRYVIHENKVTKEYEIKEIEKSQFEIVLEEVRKLIRVDELTKEELAEKVNIYEDWSKYIGKYLAKDEIVKYDRKLYKVIKGLDVLGIYPPNIVTSEYINLMPDDVIPNWVQPTGEHDSYKIGDKVIFENEVYESLINSNTWSPTSYPQGWKLI